MNRSTQRGWFYSHLDSDAGVGIKPLARGRVLLDLIIRKTVVSRDRLTLWRRVAFNNEHHRENFATRFNFKIYSHPIRGIKYSDIEGVILWRDWYEYRDTHTGARMLQSCDDPEIVAVTLGGNVVFRIERGVVTDSMKAVFPGIFDKEVVPIDDVIRQYGYEV